MPFSDEYEKLADKDKEQLGAVLNTLLSHTFILKQDPSGTELKFNDDYYFAAANIDLINEYLEVIGCRADNNTYYGVLYLSSFPDSARLRFDKLTTQMIYTLRLIYEERRDKLDSTFISLTVGELITRMMEVDLITKKPANRDISASLRKIANASIISKGKGQFDNDQTLIMILPSILMVLSESKLKETLEKLQNDEGEEEENNDEEA